MHRHIFHRSSLIDRCNLRLFGDRSVICTHVAINPIDILLVIVILLSVLNGYRRGFVHGVLDLAGWVLSLIAGLRYSQPLAQWLGPRIDVWSEVWDQPIAFVLIAIFVGVLVQAIGYALLRRLPEDINERRTNQLFGVIPGFCEWIDHRRDPLGAAARDSVE